jgi:hypothetical protein
MAAYSSDFGYYAERFLGNKVITAEYGAGNKPISGGYAEPFRIIILLWCKSSTGWQFEACLSGA